MVCELILSHLDKPLFTSYVICAPISRDETRDLRSRGISLLADKILTERSALIYRSMLQNAASRIKSTIKKKNVETIKEQENQKGGPGFN